ncbi:MAG: NADH-quinone oxidoreductase subunit M [Methanomassiliicoccales archaeon]
MFEQVPILTALLLVPLVGSFLVFALGNTQRRASIIALVVSAIPLVLSALLLIDFQLGTSTIQFVEKHTWIESYGISYYLGIDGISAPMVFLTTLLCFLAILFSWDVEHRTKEYMGLMLILEVGVVGVFTALDYFLFYVFWEVVLIPMYFLIAIWGGPRRAYASIKFFIYTHVASLAMLITIMALYFEAKPLLGYASFSITDIATVSGDFSGVFQVAAFAALFFAFGVKMPVVPFHTWLPDAHVEAPTAGSVLLAGLLLKMGSYGIIRIALPTLPVGASTLMPLMLAIAILSILYGSLVCLAQKDLKKMVAFSSISHMGIVLLGISTGSQLGIAAAVLQMFSHGLITAVLFMMCGVVQHKVGTREIPLLGGLAQKMPIAATFMTIGFLASLGLPGMIGFVAEFSVFVATFDSYAWILFLPIASVAITAGYYLWALQRTMFGPLTDKIDLTHAHDTNWYEAIPLAILAILIVFFGMFPSVVMDFITPSASVISAALGVG